MIFWKRTISILLVHTFLLSSLPIGTLQSASAVSTDTAAAKEITTNPDGVVISRDYGLVKSRFTGKNGKLIVHIQDAHCNYEAQSNIAKIIESLVKNSALSFVSVEGADGLIDTSWFKAFPDAEIRKEVANYFMKKGEITGPEFLSITTDYPIKLYGAETREYYIQNLNAFTSSYPLKDATEKYLNQIKTVLNKLKNIIYNADLKAMDLKARDYEAKTMQFNEYVRFLQAEAEKYKINLRQYDNFFKLVNVLLYEKKIDFNVTDKERSALIDELSKAVSKDVLTELVNQSIAFKVGKISSADYYYYIKALAIKNGIDLSTKFPNLYNYMIYNSVYSRIENEKLFSDIKALETAIKEKLFENEDQRSLEKLSRHIDTLLGLVNIKLLNGDFEYYKAHKDEFAPEVFEGFIKDKSIQFGLAYEMEPPADTVASSLAKLEDFYAIAIKRDKALVDNTLKGMNESGQKLAVLVTGGFHSEGIAKLLEEQDISYVVVCPNITKDVPTPYIQVLTNQRTSFEDILVGAQEPAKQNMLAPFSIAEAIAENISLNEKEILKLYGTATGKTLNNRVANVKEGWISRHLNQWLRTALNYARIHKLGQDRKVIRDAYEIAVDNALSKLVDREKAEAIRADILTPERFEPAFNAAWNRVATAAELPGIMTVKSSESARGITGNELIIKLEELKGRGIVTLRVINDMARGAPPSVPRNIEMPIEDAIGLAATMQLFYDSDKQYHYFGGGLPSAIPLASLSKEWDAVKDSPQIAPADLKAFIKEVYTTLKQIYQGAIEAYSLTNIKQMNETSPDLYLNADNELAYRSNGMIHPLLAIENSEERKHDFPAFTNNILRLYFEFYQKELRAEGIIRYEDFLANKASQMNDDKWERFYDRFIKTTVIVITDGGLKTRAGNETLGRLHSGLWTFVKGLDARILNLIVNLTILKMMPENLRNQVLVWSASDNYTWLGKSNIVELLKKPEIADKFAVLTSGAKVKLIDKSELAELDKVVRFISEKEDLKDGWETILASEEKRSLFFAALNTAPLDNIRERIKSENLRELGIYTVFPKGDERAYEMSGFWEKCKDDLKIIKIAHLNKDKGILYKNPFGEILHKRFIVEMMKRLSKEKSNTLAECNIDYTGLDALPVSYMTAAYQSRFFTDAEWEEIVPTIEIASKKIKINMADWLKIKNIFDELFNPKNDRSKLYCFDLGEGHIWQDTGHLSPVHQLFEYIAFTKEGRMSMNLPDSDQNLINTNLEVCKNLIVSNKKAKYLIDNVCVIGGGNIEILTGSDRIVMSNVAIYVPVGKTWRIPPRTQVLDAAFRWDRVNFSRGAYKRGYIRISNFFPEMNTPNVTMRCDENVNTIRIGVAGGGYRVMTSRSTIFLPFKYDDGMYEMICDYLKDIAKWKMFLELYPDAEKKLGIYISNDSAEIPADVKESVKKEGIGVLSLHLPSFNANLRNKIAHIVYSAMRDEHSDILLGSELEWDKVKNIPGSFFSFENPGGLGGFTFTQAQKKIDYKATDECRSKNLRDLKAASMGNYSLLEKHFVSWAPQQYLIRIGVAPAYHSDISNMTQEEREAMIRVRASEIYKARTTGSDTGNWTLAEEELIVVGVIPALNSVQGAITRNFVELTPEQKIEVNTTIKTDFETGQAGRVETIGDVEIYIIPGLEKLAYLIAHPGKGGLTSIHSGEEPDHSKRRIYMSPSRYAWFKNLKKNDLEAYNEFVKHEIYHLDHPGLNEKEVIDSGEAGVDKVRAYINETEKSAIAGELNEPVVPGTVEVMEVIEEKVAGQTREWLENIGMPKNAINEHLATVVKYGINIDISELETTTGTIAILTKPGGIRDDVTVILAQDMTDVSDSTRMAIQSGNDFIEGNLKDSVKCVRGEGDSLVVAVKEEIKKLESQGRRYAVVASGKHMATKTETALLGIIKSVNALPQAKEGDKPMSALLKIAGEKDMSIAALQSLSLRIGFNLGKDNIMRSLQSVAKKEDGTPFESSDWDTILNTLLNKGFLALQPLHPINVNEADEAHRAEAAALRSL